MLRRTTAASLIALASLGCSPSPPEPPEPRQAAAPAPVAPLAPIREYSEQRDPCSDYARLRNAYFGDFHVHTNVSMDAYIFGTNTTARDAYRFARGEAIPSALTSMDDTQMIQLERPLDFAAVTDHASFLGEVKLCTTPGTPAYDSRNCKMYRGEIEARLPEGLALGGNAVSAAIGARMAALADPNGGILADGSDIPRAVAVCGPDGDLCRQWSRTVWQDEQAAADEAYDRSSECAFSAFNAYEYTATPGLSKVHRNIIFRNDTVVDSPIAYADVPNEYDMWAALDEQCLQADSSCDVITIPHNSNLSNGRMFQIDYTALPEAEQRERVELRAELEPLVEIMQIKGDSECRNGLASVVGRDELCDFERYRAPEIEWDDCGDGGGAGALAGQGCISRRDYVRYALVEGLREEERLGINPFKLGFIASTDAHNSNLGDVQERSFDGWSGIQDSTPQKRLQGTLATLQPIASNPGGLVGVWAEENSRDSLFDALRRRESFGTSGPRIQPRFFGGWSYDEALCDGHDLLERSYAEGVAMGGDLPAKPGHAKAPRFVVSALRDPGTDAFPGGKLQRIQIIKGWAGEAGSVHQRVFDVAGTPDNGAGVDPATCEPQGTGHQSLCAVWVDPEFDPSLRAVYYARVIENPSCRWSTWQCLAQPAADRPAACSDASIPKLIQERAWTSPIWYAPDA
ncbi:MAG: DUF3604 domain-containing protein [Myxococcota bacterium]|nr:DUF3604 domain-containing protein [Myxococcota bacterium]